MDQKILKFGTYEVPLPSHITNVDEARVAMQAIIPALADAEGSLEGNTFTFTKKAGTKGC